MRPPGGGRRGLTRCEVRGDRSGYRGWMDGAPAARTTGPIDVSRSPHARLRPLAGRLDGGYWGDRQRLNREVLLRDAPQRLEDAGNFDDLRAAAGLADVPYRGMVFMD